ncbi:hypothetical protein ACYSNR_16165 [Enterococcus sp. LJL128]
MQNEFKLAVSLDKWLNDGKWSEVKTKIYFEYIEINPLKDSNIIEFVSTHIKLMTVDKRAMYIVVLELAKELGGRISEDEMRTWQSVAEFEKKHKSILSLTFEEANERSLKEAPLK